MYDILIGERLLEEEYDAELRSHDAQLAKKRMTSTLVVKRHPNFYGTPSSPPKTKRIRLPRLDSTDAESSTPSGEGQDSLVSDVEVIEPSSLELEDLDPSHLQGFLDSQPSDTVHHIAIRRSCSSPPSKPLMFDRFKLLKTVTIEACPVVYLLSALGHDVSVTIIECQCESTKAIIDLRELQPFTRLEIKITSELRRFLLPIGCGDIVLCGPVALEGPVPGVTLNSLSGVSAVTELSLIRVAIFSEMGPGAARLRVPSLQTLRIADVSFISSCLDLSRCGNLRCLILEKLVLDFLIPPVLVEESSDAFTFKVLTEYVRAGGKRHDELREKSFEIVNQHSVIDLGSLAVTCCPDRAEWLDRGIWAFPDLLSPEVALNHHCSVLRGKTIEGIRRAIRMLRSISLDLVIINTIANEFGALEILDLSEHNNVMLLYIKGEMNDVRILKFNEQLLFIKIDTRVRVDLKSLNGCRGLRKLWLRGCLVGVRPTVWNMCGMINLRHLSLGDMTQMPHILNIQSCIRLEYLELRSVVFEEVRMPMAHPSLPVGQANLTGIRCSFSGTKIGGICLNGEAIFLIYPPEKRFYNFSKSHLDELDSARIIGVKPQLVWSALRQWPSHIRKILFKECCGEKPKNQNHELKMFRFRRLEELQISSCEISFFLNEVREGLRVRVIECECKQSPPFEIDVTSCVGAKELTVQFRTSGMRIILPSRCSQLIVRGTQEEEAGASPDLNMSDLSSVNIGQVTVIGVNLLESGPGVIEFNSPKIEQLNLVTIQSLPQLIDLSGCDSLRRLSLVNLCVRRLQIPVASNSPGSELDITLQMIQTGVNEIPDRMDLYLPRGALIELKDLDRVHCCQGRRNKLLQGQWEPPEKKNDFIFHDKDEVRSTKRVNEVSAQRIGHHCLMIENSSLRDVRDLLNKGGPVMHDLMVDACWTSHKSSLCVDLRQCHNLEVIYTKKEIEGDSVFQFHDNMKFIKISGFIPMKIDFLRTSRNLSYLYIGGATLIGGNEQILDLSGCVQIRELTLDNVKQLPERIDLASCRNLKSITLGNGRCQEVLMPSTSTDDIRCTLWNFQLGTEWEASVVTRLSYKGAEGTFKEIATTIDSDSLLTQSDEET